MKSPRAALLLQLAVSMVLLVLLARKVPIPEAAAALARIEPGTLALCLVLALVAYWGRARRWAMLLRRSGVRLPAFEAYRLTLIGTFYGLVTPGRVGEFARVLHIGAPRADTLPSVVWDRVVDVLLLEALCIPAFAAVPAWRGGLLGIYLGLVGLTVAGIALLSHPGAMRALARVVPPLARSLGRWSEHTPGLLKQGASSASILWGLFFYAFMYAIAGLLLRDLAPHASVDLVIGQPVIALLGNLPIALGGLGLREQVSAALFEQYGAGAATGAAYSLLVFTVLTLLPALIGMVVPTAGGGRRPTADEVRP